LTALSQVHAAAADVAVARIAEIERAVGAVAATPVVERASRTG
jgi:hypothetical protein